MCAGKRDLNWGTKPDVGGLRMHMFVYEVHSFEKKNSAFPVNPWPNTTPPYFEGGLQRGCAVLPIKQLSEHHSQTHQCCPQGNPECFRLLRTHCFGSWQRLAVQFATDSGLQIIINASSSLSLLPSSPQSPLSVHKQIQTTQHHNHHVIEYREGERSRTLPSCACGVWGEIETESRQQERWETWTDYIAC